MARLLRWLLVLGVLGAAYWWFAVDARPPRDARWQFDLEAVRALAGLPGDGPAAVRYENPVTLRFPAAMITAGDGWSWRPMPVYSYQLVWPDRTIVVDAAMDRATSPPSFLLTSFDDSAYGRVQDALQRAAQVVVTHEHMDHIGGIATHPQRAALSPGLRLTDVQLAHPERMQPAQLSAADLPAYVPLHYEGMHALAPGVVLVAAPGHTPGSQVVYVRRADGVELLLLGDVVWHRRNIEVQRERPRWVTDWLIDEDRVAVWGQIATLHALAQSEPSLHIVPGHDGAVVDSLRAQGVLEQGFQP